MAPRSTPCATSAPPSPLTKLQSSLSLRTPLSSCTASSVGNILDISYNFNSGAGDNGNVMSITNNIDNLRSETFTYDTLNRILTAQTNATYSTSSTKCWGESYSYDPWGNLLGTGWPSSSYASCTQESPGPGGAVGANNQLSTDTYDAAGNIIAMPNGSSYSYDAENHLLSTAGVNYTGVYPERSRGDGDGNRAEKSSGTIYWQGGLNESTLSGTLTNEYIFFHGQRIARRDPSSNVFYNFADHLGTARSIAEVPSGQTTATKCYDADLYPFGGERWYTDTCDSHYKFTGKERDPESGLDNFGARYNSSSLGRFMSPDEIFADQHSADPQTWNLYSYTRNNPLKLIDPTGRYFVVATQDVKFFQKALANIYRRRGGRELINALAKSDRPVLLDRSELNTATTGIAGVSQALAINGTPGVAGVHTTIGTDAGLFAGAHMAPGKVGSDVSTALELEHDEQGLSKGQTSLPAGTAAMAAGDASDSPGKTNTLGGTAQEGAEEIMNEKPDMSSGDANAAVRGILQNGQQQWQNSADRAAICSQNPGACH